MIMDDEKMPMGTSSDDDDAVVADEGDEAAEGTESQE